jgi:hypothetical protein
LHGVSEVLRDVDVSSTSGFFCVMGASLSMVFSNTDVESLVSTTFTTGTLA